MICIQINRLPCCCQIQPSKLIVLYTSLAAFVSQTQLLFKYVLSISNHTKRMIVVTVFVRFDIATKGQSIVFCDFGVAQIGLFVCETFLDTNSMQGETTHYFVLFSSIRVFNDMLVQKYGVIRPILYRSYIQQVRHLIFSKSEVLHLRSQFQQSQVYQHPVMQAY